MDEYPYVIPFDKLKYSSDSTGLTKFTILDNYYSNWLYANLHPGDWRVAYPWFSGRPINELQFRNLSDYTWFKLVKL